MKIKKLISISLSLCILFVGIIPLYISANNVYNTTVSANGGTVVTANSSWGAADLFRSSTCYRITPSAPATIVYSVTNATRFMVTAAQHSGLSQLLSFEVSTDETNYTAVNMTVNTIGGYTTGTNWLINEQEYISPDFATPIISIRIAKAECYNEWYFAMVDLKYQTAGVDKASLQTLIDSVSNYNEAYYTTVSWSAFSISLGNANIVNNNDGATQQQVNNAKTDLQNAVNNLIFDSSVLGDSYNAVSQFSATVQGPFWYYTSTQDRATYTPLPFSNIPTSTNVIWWSRTETVTWGSATLIKSINGNIMMFRDGKDYCPAIAFKAPKSGYVELAYENDLFDIYNGADLNSLTVVADSTAAIHVDKDEYIVFVLKADKYGNAELNVGNPTVNYVEPIPLVSIALNKTSLNLMKGGSDTLFISTYTPSNTNESKQVTWSSDDEKVATVSLTGVVKAVSSGTAKITATVGTKTAICNISINEPLENISIKSSTVIGLGATETLTVTYNPTGTTDDKTVIWTSSDESIVTVLSDGTVEGKALGTATITAKVGAKTDTCFVQVVIPLLSITINSTLKTITKGDSFQLTLTKNPSNTTISDPINWASTNSSIATVDNNGLVTAIGSGQATITASISGKTVICNITVKSPLISISLNKTTIQLVNEFTDTLTLNFYPFDTSDSKAVIWSTSNDKVVGVSGGTVTAVSVGTATITAKVGGKIASCVVTVVNPNKVISSTSSKSDSNSTTDNELTSSSTKPNTGDTTPIITLMAILIFSILALSALAIKKVIRM